jgi:MEDS: MEthanogen/methylotroph, DcmR Sensory domain
MCQHLVLFYDDIYPAEEVSDFFAAGLDAGDSCLALLSAPHRRAVEQCLQARGVRIESAAYVGVDTDEVLSQLLVDDRLDMSRAGDMLTPLMKPSVPGSKCRVRAVGDLAPRLCAAGNTDDAVAFEGLVHRLTREHDASVICAYPLQTVGGRDGMGALMRLSAVHASVEFPARLWAHHLLQAAPHHGSQGAGGQAAE